MQMESQPASQPLRFGARQFLAPLRSPQVGVAVLAGEQADGPYLRRQQVLGGQQQPGTDSLSLPVGGDHEPDELGGAAATWAWMAPRRCLV